MQRGLDMAVKYFSLRLEEDMLKKLHYIADYDDRSVNSQIVSILRQSIKEFEQKHGAISLENKLEP